MIKGVRTVNVMAKLSKVVAALKKSDLYSSTLEGR